MFLNQTSMDKGRRYMAEILPIRRKTLYNQSINQSMDRYFQDYTD